MLSLKDFKKDYVFMNNTTLLLFKEIEQILSLNEITLLNKQRRIEKLMNIYSLNKSEQIFQINPLWHNKIIEVFKDQIHSFEIHYNLMLKEDIKKNFFKPIKLNVLFTTKELFNICIYCYFNNVSKLKDQTFLDKTLELTIMLKSTFHTEVREQVKYFFKNKITYYFLFIFQNKIKLTDLKNKITETELILNMEKGNVENYKITLRYLVENKYDYYLNKFTLFIKQNEASLDRFLNKITIQLAYIFVDINIFNYFKIRKGKKLYDFINIIELQKFNELNIMCYLSSKLPMLVPPVDWTLKGTTGGYLLNKYNNFTKLVKPLSSGKSSIKYSTYSINILNLVQKKGYKININFYKYIKTNLFLKEKKMLNISEMYDIYLELHKQTKILYRYLKECNVTKEDITMYLHEENKIKYMSINKFKVLIKNKKASKEDFLLYKKNKIIEVKKQYKITDSLMTVYKKHMSIHNKLFKYVNMYKYHTMILEVVRLFKYLKIYMPNNTDFRGRFFPSGINLHRASGAYKYLLYTDEDIFIYDNNSINKLKEAIALYYKPFINYTKDTLYQWFNIYINISNESKSYKNKVLQWMYKFISNVNNHALDSSIINDKYIKRLLKLIYEAKDIHLFIFCLLEYFNYECDNTYNSIWTLDIDQCSSGPMIYSLLSKDKKMANLTNCIPFNTNIKKDLYDFFVTKCKEQLLFDKESIKHNITLKINIYLLKIFDLFFTRTFSKMLIMPTFYNMGEVGIKELVINQLFSLDNKLKTKALTFLKANLKKVIPYLLTFFNNILNKEFHNTINYQKYLVDICTLLYKHEEPINIKTLDGSIISYKYLQKKNTYSTVYLNHKKTSHRIFLPYYDNIQYVLSKRQIISFPPNWIHSIDASICKIIIHIYYQLFKRILEPLHDSFRINLKEIDNLIVIIKYVYLFYFFNNYFFKNKIGIIFNNSGSLVFEHNSKKHIFYKEYFPIHEKNIDVLNYTFLNQLKVNIDIETKIKKIPLSIGAFECAQVKQFLTNNYMFYF